MSKEVPKKDKSYFLRTQSSILKGHQNIPFNSLKPQTKHKNNSYSKNKNNKPKKIYIHFSTGNKQIKSKKYITSKKNNDKMFQTFSNFGGIDLNQVSGSSHTSKFVKNNNNNIIPKEGDTFSISGNNIEKQNNNIYRKNKENENEKNLVNKNIYNSRLYSPFYELIEKLDKRSYNNNYDLNSNGNNFNENMSNTHFLSSNRIIEINNKDNNNLNKYINKGNINNNNNQNQNIKINKYNTHKYNIEQKYFNDNNENEYLNGNILFTKSDLPQNDYTNNNQQISNEPYFTTQTNIKENLDINDPKEEYKDSILAKTMNLLTNNHNNNERYNIKTTYQMQSSSYFNDSNLNKNYFNNFNDNNYNYNKIKDPNESFRVIYNKYPNHKKLTYHYYESKNNSNRINYNNNSSKRNNSNKRTNSLYNNNKDIYLNDRLNKKNDINDNNINNIYNMNNINKINNENSINDENLFMSTQKSNNDNIPKILNHSEIYYQGNPNPNLSTKYFLKPIFDENSTNNYVNNFNNFSLIKQNNNTVLLPNYNINDMNIKKERRLTPNNNLFNASNSNKLKKLLKDIPSHKMEKINKYNEIFSNINGDLRKRNKSSDIYDINKKIKSVEDMEGIMPPNVIICNQQ